MTRGTYGGQEVQEGAHGRLVYDCQPDDAAGCLVAVPGNFLGIPEVTGQLDGPQQDEPEQYEHEWEPGA
jgi:hypothetical protein